jgi:putative chitinase
MDLTRLQGLIPAGVIEQIPEVITRFQINTPVRLAHFLAQCGHESGGFVHVRENLNYSAQALVRVFPRHFNTATANEYQRNSERIANRAYASRMGNGNEASGDGWRFRGRGYIQLTGRNNYAAFDAFVPESILTEPDLVATKYPLLSAAWFWHTNKLNAIADTGTLEAVTRSVNGGTNGLEDRRQRFNRLIAALRPLNA